MLSVKVLTNTGDFEPGGIYWSLPVDHMGYYTIHNPKTKTNWSLREEDIVIVNSSINDVLYFSNCATLCRSYH